MVGGRRLGLMRQLYLGWWKKTRSDETAVSEEKNGLEGGVVVVVVVGE